MPTGTVGNNTDPNEPIILGMSFDVGDRAITLTELGAFTGGDFAGPTSNQPLDFGAASAWFDPIPDQTINEDVLFSFALNLTDLGLQRDLTFSFDGSAPAAASIDPVTGLFTGSGAEAGVYPIIVRATDASLPANSQSRTFVVVVEEVGPSNPGVRLEDRVLQIFGSDDADLVNAI